MDWATFWATLWATFSQTHLAFLLMAICADV
jgi:hypothetical protein